MGELGSVIRAGQGCLEDLPRAEGLCAQKAGDADVQAGGEPDDGKINEPAQGVIPQLPGVPAVGAGVVHGHRGGVDDGDGAGVGGSGDREADFCGAADGVGDEVASSLQGAGPWCVQMVV